MEKYCNNCGNKGHLYRNCRHPILSYGIFIYTKDKNGEYETGVTIHIVDGGYDSGMVISQEKVEVLVADSVEDLRRRVQEVEHRLWVKVLQDICES